MSKLDPLHSARQARKKMLEEGTILDPIQKSHANPSSLRLAINGKCWDCSCGQIKEIKLCTIPDCTLYPVRPYQPKEEKDARRNNPT